MRLGVLASGRGTNASAIFEAIRDGRLDLEAAVLVCDRADAPALDIAAAFDVPTVLVDRGRHAHRSERQAAILAALTGAGVDLVALAGFAAVLDDAVVDAFEERMLNMHPSLLPAFAGSVSPGPQAAALAAGVSLAGCTVHLVTAEVDAGPIVAQAAVPVRPDDSVETLGARILAQEHRLFPLVLQWFAEGRVHVRDGIARLEVAAD
jgi:phosphoribosylglycinamide formyltransferase-1